MDQKLKKINEMLVLFDNMTITYSRILQNVSSQVSRIQLLPVCSKWVLSTKTNNINANNCK